MAVMVDPSIGRVGKLIVAPVGTLRESVLSGEHIVSVSRVVGFACRSHERSADDGRCRIIDSFGAPSMD